MNEKTKPHDLRFAVLHAAVLVAAVSLGQRAWAFTDGQAAAGRAAYEQSCAACHGANMRQLPASILAGSEFVAKWGERSTGELLAQISSTMPPDRPGALGQDQYLGIIAYVLQSNGGAPGEIGGDARQQRGRQLVRAAVREVHVFVEELVSDDAVRALRGEGGGGIHHLARASVRIANIRTEVADHLVERRIRPEAWQHCTG